MPEHAAEGAAPPGRPRAFEAVVYGGLAVGVLDGLAAVISAGLRGVGPVIVFRYIASGLLGPDAYTVGREAVLLGVLLHFLVAFSAAAVYYGASLGLPLLLRRAVLCGALYGVAVYFFMGRVVVPLSLGRGLAFSPAQLGIHILCVGLPIALVARWSAARNRAAAAAPGAG